MDREAAAIEAIDIAERTAFDEWKAELKAERSMFHWRQGVSQWDAFSAGFSAAMEIARLVFLVDAADREHSARGDHVSH